MLYLILGGSLSNLLVLCVVKDTIFVLEFRWLFFVHTIVLYQVLYILLEVWFYMNGPSKLAAPISCKQFFGLKFSFELTKCTFVCSNQLN